MSRKITKTLDRTKNARCEKCKYLSDIKNGHHYCDKIKMISHIKTDKYCVSYCENKAIKCK